MHVLIAGGTGMTGRALSKYLLSKGYRVTVLSRFERKFLKSGTEADYTEKNPGNVNQEKTPDNNNPEKIRDNGIEYTKWDPKKGLMDEAILQDVDVVIHVAGANVGDKRWTAKRKKEILDSRIQTTEMLYKAIRLNPGRLKTFIGASATGWYGPDPNTPSARAFTEDMPASGDFLGSTTQTWEEGMKKIEDLGIRVVIFRTGIVLSTEGGAYPEFLRPLKFGLATILGTGNQAISWIHIDDLCRLYLFAIENPVVSGIYNAVAPSPVSNRNMICEIAAQKRKQFYIPIYIPSFLLKVVLGELSIEVLKGTTVSNEKIRRTGFQFLYPNLESAIKAL